MAISLSLYDFFAHLVPGGVVLMAFLYAFQESWLRSPSFSALTTAQLLVIALLSYILGYVVDPLANRWYRLFRQKGTGHVVHQKSAESIAKYYKHISVDSNAMGWYVLLAYIKRRNLPMAQEIERFNVTHIMLRGISLGAMFFALVFCVKVVTHTQPWLYAVCSLLNMAIAYSLMQEAIKFRSWFYQAIYQFVLALQLKPDDLPVRYQASSTKQV